MERLEKTLAKATIEETRSLGPAPGNVMAIDIDEVMERAFEQAFLKS
jgi:hypothetical protein